MIIDAFPSVQYVRTTVISLGREACALFPSGLVMDASTGLDFDVFSNPSL